MVIGWRVFNGRSWRQPVAKGRSNTPFSARIMIYVALRQ
jgi:hypothetical protein